MINNILGKLIGKFRKTNADFHSPGHFTVHLTNMYGNIIPKPMLIDPAAISTDPEKPPFVAPPKGSPAYYAYPLIKQKRRVLFWGCDGLSICRLGQRMYYWRWIC